jgi:TnpA family transposase
MFAVDTPFTSCTVRLLWTEAGHYRTGVECKVARRALLKEQEQKTLLDIPTDEDSLIRHSSLSPTDLLEIQLRRREHNHLGFAVQLCLMRHPGRPQLAIEVPPKAILDYVDERATEIRQVAQRGRASWL